MRELKLTTVIATDHHFHQVGFDVLPECGFRKRASRVAPDALSGGRPVPFTSSHAADSNARPISADYDRGIRSRQHAGVLGVTMARMARRISRRRFVHGTVRLALFTPLIHLEQLTAAGQTRTPFRAVDRRTLRAAADVIIPAQRQMPAASALGAVRYIERIAAADRAVQDLLSDGLRAIAAHAEAIQKARFDQLPVERQTEVLAYVERTNTPTDFFRTLRDLVYEAYYTQPRVQKLIRYNFRSGRRRTAPLAPFDEQLVARVRQQKPIYRQVS